MELEYKDLRNYEFSEEKIIIFHILQPVYKPLSCFCRHIRKYLVKFNLIIIIIEEVCARARARARACVCVCVSARAIDPVLSLEQLNCSVTIYKEAIFVRRKSSDHALTSLFPRDVKSEIQYANFYAGRLSSKLHKHIGSS